MADNLKLYEDKDISAPQAHVLELIKTCDKPNGAAIVQRMLAERFTWYSCSVNAFIPGMTLDELIKESFYFDTLYLCTDVESSEKWAEFFDEQGAKEVLVLAAQPKKNDSEETFTSCEDFKDLSSQVPRESKALIVAIWIPVIEKLSAEMPYPSTMFNRFK